MGRVPSIVLRKEFYVIMRRRNEFGCRYVFEGKPGETTRIRIMVFDLYSS